MSEEAGLSEEYSITLFVVHISYVSIFANFLFSRYTLRVKIHFVGIGGIGTSALAQLCLVRGDEISGSDVCETEIFPALRKLDIKLFTEQKAENVPDDVDILVYSEAVPLENPERMRAAELGRRQYSYFEYLGKVSENYKVIAVAGTHGKTTTTAMIARGCMETEFDPSVIVGTTLKEFEGSNFHLGTDNWLVVEACEYRENFRFLKPEIVILTSVEHDHFDAFPTEESYFSAFENFVKSSKLVIYHEHDLGAEKVLKKYTGARLAVPCQSEHSWEYLLKVSGQYNYDNATLALALASELGLNTENFKRGLSQYTGAGRRQEFLGEHNGVKLYDDYAHHPSEIRALLQGFRKTFPAAKIGIIFEPHQHSRTVALIEEFREALSIADKVGLFPIYPARDSEEEKKAMPDSKLRSFVPNSVAIDSQEDAKKFIAQFSSGDIVIFCGAGNISQFVRKLFV
jgi:UDP-N-acetylmuramate--alanine ligase